MQINVYNITEHLNLSNDFGSSVHPWLSADAVLIHGCIKRAGYRVRGWATFIPIIIAQWRMKKNPNPKKLLLFV